MRGVLRAAITTVGDRHPFTIHAWVLLPDHPHCLGTLPPGDADYSLRWNLIKRSVSVLLRIAYGSVLNAGEYESKTPAAGHQRLDGLSNTDAT